MKMNGRTVEELLCDAASSHETDPRPGAPARAHGMLNRRSALAGAALVSIGFTFAGAGEAASASASASAAAAAAAAANTPGHDVPILVDGWVVLPSDIKPLARG